MSESLSDVRMWRCYNPKCADAPGTPGHNFTAAEAKCPKCGLERKDPRYGHLIEPLVVMHWETDHPVVEGGGSGLAACSGKPLVGRHTRAASVANCPACLATESHAKALHDVTTHPDYQVPVVIDLEKQTVRLDR